MSKKSGRFDVARARDTLTAELFDIPRAAPASPGSVNYSREIAAAMSQALKDCPHDRIEVSARMTRLLGREMSLSMLNAYTAESHTDHNISLERAIAFDIATEGRALLKFYAAKLGCGVLVGDEIMHAEIGRIHELRDKLAVQERAIRDYLKGRR